MHASGGRYEWLAGLAPWESELAAIPGWLVPELQESRSASRIRRPQACGNVGRSQDVSRLPSKFQDLVRRGNRGEYESRSEADMAVCVAMFGAGYRPGEVWAVMTDPGNAISEKYLDKGYRGGDYLELTISRAHEYHKARLAGRGVVYECRRGGVSLG
jgi:hypothetical protein